MSVKNHMPFQREVRVASFGALPGTGVLGVKYTIEPGQRSYYWTGSAYQIIESWPLTPVYTDVFSDPPST